MNIVAKSFQTSYLRWRNPKGQMISKGLLVSSNSPKKRTNEFVVVVKTNLFVCFLGEFEETKSPFQIIWPLVLPSSKPGFKSLYLYLIFIFLKYLTHIFEISHFFQTGKHCDSLSLKASEGQGITVNIYRKVIGIV